MEQVDQGDGFIVRVRGLPWSATRDDIVNFFSPVAVTGGPQGVHFTFTRDGRPSGEAFIEFSSADDLEAALLKHNAHMGKRYVEVFRSKKSEREWVLQKNGQGGGKVEAVVRLRGLPYGCGKEDIEQFFSGLQIAANGITLTSDMEGRSSGEAFVEFTSAEEADKALGRHRQAMAHRYVEVFRSNTNELKIVREGEARGGYGNSRHTPYERGRQGDYDPAFHNRYGSGYERRYRGGNRGGYSRDDGLQAAMYSDQYYSTFGQYEIGYSQGYGMRRDMRDMGVMERGGNRMGMTMNARATTPHCVRMRGLPFSATEQNVLEFFAPLTPVAVHMEYDRQGRASGEATVDFATHEEASEAMGKNRQSMGEQECYVIHVVGLAYF
jgi:heterogeneous nuclear ribonucleoprotein F/H